MAAVVTDRSSEKGTNLLLVMIGGLCSLTVLGRPVCVAWSIQSFLPGYIDHVGVVVF